MLTWFFTSEDVTDYDTAKTSDTAKFGRFFHCMLERGVYLPPSQFEAMFVSAAHTDEDIALTLAMFGGFTEGLQLFASFAMLMNFPRFNKMKGMGQIVSWSIRDESLHCEGITRLFHTFVKERDCLTKAVKEDIIDCCQKTVRLEDAFIDLAFEMGPVPGMSAKEIKRYIRYIADWRLGQLGLPAIYMIEDHPLPWLAPLLNGVEMADSAMDAVAGADAVGHHGGRQVELFTAPPRDAGCMRWGMCDLASEKKP